MPDLEGALQRLYEDAAIRDELRDPEAETLLRWAEAQLTRLAERHDDDSFEQRADTLRELLKSINRFIGRRGDMDADARAAKLTAMARLAGELGAEPADEAVQAFGAGLGGLDDAAALAALTQLLIPGSAEPKDAPAGPSDDTPLAPPGTNRYPGRTPLYPHTKPRTGESTSNGETENDDTAC